MNKKMGWECPKCGRVYAPTWFECQHCNKPKESPPRPRYKWQNGDLHPVATPAREG